MRFFIFPRLSNFLMLFILDTVWCSFSEYKQFKSKCRNNFFSFFYSSSVFQFTWCLICIAKPNTVKYHYTVNNMENIIWYFGHVASPSQREQQIMADILCSLYLPGFLCLDHAPSCLRNLILGLLVLVPLQGSTVRAETVLSFCAPFWLSLQSALWFCFFLVKLYFVLVWGTCGEIS